MLRSGPVDGFRLPYERSGSVGGPAAVLRHFWTHWSGPDYQPEAGELDRLAGAYGEPGAFAASIAWYRAGAGTVATSLAETPPEPGDRLRVPTAVLWPGHDPLFPRAWGDRIDEFFADATVHDVPDAGHFVPLEAPEAFAGAVADALGL